MMTLRRPEARHPVMLSQVCFSLRRLLLESLHQEPEYYSHHGSSSCRAFQEGGRMSPVPVGEISISSPHLPSQSVSPQARTLGEVLLNRVSLTPNQPAAFQKIDGRWHKWTWQEFGRRSLRIAHGLVDAGCRAGDRVGILGPTWADWGVCDFAGQLAGMVTFGIYPKQTVEQVQYLLRHSECRVLFVADDESMETVIQAARDSPELVAIVAWQPDLANRWAEKDPRITSIEAFGKEVMDEQQARQRMAAIDPEETAILIYTSGTTGPPKGAMISHQNILTLLRHHQSLIDFYQDDMLFSFLPMAHASERILGFFVRVDSGVATAYASSIGSVLQEISEVRPTIFGSVPRIFEKMYDRIQGEVAKGSPIKQAIFRSADRIARRRLALVLENRPIPLLLRVRHAVGDRLIFSKIRRALGGRIRFCIAGAAPISYEILEFLWAAGLPVYEAYGMTEATVVTHMNRVGESRLGTVGRPVPDVECKIAEDGEVLVRGKMVFKGYFKNPEATAETVVDGWLHTGDIGVVDAEGFLRITDRKKHLIITAGGKNVAPANIERAIKNQHPLISQVHAHGDRRAYITALIAPSPLETIDWGLENGILKEDEAAERRSELMADPSSRTEALSSSMAKVVADPRFQGLFKKPIQEGNRELARVERVRRYFVLGRDLSREQDEMTPTMKMKRKAIEELHADAFDRLYTDPSFGFDA